MAVYVLMQGTKYHSAGREHMAKSFHAHSHADRWCAQVSVNWLEDDHLRSSSSCLDMNLAKQ